MKEVENKLDRITSIWNHFIWEYDYCKRKIKFTPDVKTNFVGDIFGYFQDTFDIIFDKKESKSFSDRFSNNISLLQSIYIQQDFIEELLIIFKCRINKGELKADSTYSVNREIRNELIGHPIRRIRGQFISSSLFGYKGGSDKIVYLRYHKDKNYELELVEFAVSEIIKRHVQFLNKYFDKILSKLKHILTEYVKEIENFEGLINTRSFEEILNVSLNFYESIFKTDFIYDKESLTKIYTRKDEHKRYQNLINKFYNDLKSGLKETKNYARELFEVSKENENSEFEKPMLSIKFIDASKMESKDLKIPVTYHYELGKLATRRTPLDFEFFAGCLKQKCSDNEIVLNELDHMQKNMYDDIEYYTAYRLIRTELNID